MDNESQVTTDNQNGEGQNTLLPFNGAKVQLPCHCPDDVLTFVIEAVKQLRKDSQNSDLDIVEKIRDSMDKEYGPYWHVVCGKNFGSYAIHQQQQFMFFYYQELAYLVYKAG